MPCWPKISFLTFISQLSKEHVRVIQLAGYHLPNMKTRSTKEVEPFEAKIHKRAIAGIHTTLFQRLGFDSRALTQVVSEANTSSGDAGGDQFFTDLVWS